MSIEVRPMGEACQLACDYCYQESVRDAGNVNIKYDLKKIIDMIDKMNQPFHLFGGEALLVPKRDLEILWKHGLDKYGRNGVQTNGALIDNDHIQMFKDYNVYVGISIDGPNELNSLRKVRGKEKDEDATLAATKRTMDSIVQLINNNIQVGIIITLHKQNATTERLPRLLSFIRWLGDIGIKSGNIHTLEVDETMKDAEVNVLSQEENAKAFLEIAEFLEENSDLDWNPFSDMKQILNARDGNTTCYWNNCDPLNTQAVYGIEGDGSISNCGRTNKEGIGWYKADDNNYARYIALYHTPDEMGGCKGCRFWMACGGSCPGEAQNNDFRNKTIHCHTMKTMLSFYEEELEKNGIEPITKSAKRMAIEELILDGLYQNQKYNINLAMSIIESFKSPIMQVEVTKEIE